jgi:hypothetical protein
LQASLAKLGHAAEKASDAWTYPRCGKRYISVLRGWAAATLSD